LKRQAGGGIIKMRRRCLYRKHLCEVAAGNFRLGCVRG